MTKQQHGRELRLTEAEWRARDSLCRHWADFCDADPVPENFIDEMERAGFAELRKVTRSDLQDEFASERGIYKGGWVWHLTALGRAIVSEPAPASATEARSAETGTGSVHEGAVGSAETPDPTPTGVSPLPLDAGR